MNNHSITAELDNLGERVRTVGAREKKKSKPDYETIISSEAPKSVFNRLLYTIYCGLYFKSTI